MEKKSLNLTDVNLSKEQLIDLFNIAFSVISLAKHDLIGNSILPLTLMLERWSRGFVELSPEQSKRNLEELHTVLRKLRELFNTYFQRRSHSEFDDSFISRPFDLVESIRGIHSNSEISIASDSLITLEIVYPENILFGILTELVQNSEKHNTSNSRIVIKWHVEGKQFQCEVHDNGVGIAPTIGPGFYPLDALIHRNDLQLNGESGLSILNRIIVLSKGILLFSKSQLLGGTLVYFELPVFGHN
jgi:signal transduction histidine kinase